MGDIMELDIDAIMEGTESTLDIIFDEDQALEAEVEATTISDDIDDSTIDSIIGYDELVTDQDIEDIDNGKTPSGGDPIDQDADDGMDDPEIFKLQKDIFQNSLLTDNDIKDLNEGMSLEDFTAKVLRESVETPTIGEIEGAKCTECGHEPCICDKTKDAFDLDGEYNTYDMKEIIKSDDDDDDDDFDFDDDDDDDDNEDDDDDDEDDDDDDDDKFKLDDEINAPSFTPAGPIQPLNDGRECGTNCAAEEAKNNLNGGRFEMEDKEMLGDAFEQGYNEALEDIDAALEAAESKEDEDIFIEALEDLDEDPDLFSESEKLEEDSDESYDESVEEFEEETEELLAETSEDIEDLDSIDEALEDIKIFNKFEGSGINDDDYNANDDLFTGWKDNVDEKGLKSYEDQNTLPFDHVTSSSFDNMDKDDSIEAMLK